MRTTVRREVVVNDFYWDKGGDLYHKDTLILEAKDAWTGKAWFIILDKKYSWRGTEAREARFVCEIT